MYKTKTVQFHMGYTAFNSTVYMTWEICSLIHGPSHPSVYRMQYLALALQATNAEVRRPGYEGRSTLHSECEGYQFSKS